MHRLAFVLLLSVASCGSSLGDPNQPAPPPTPTTTTLSHWGAADCQIFHPAACRLDLAKASVGIDINYPNTYFCRVQILPSSGLLGDAVFRQLGSTWQVAMGYGPDTQAVITPEMPSAVLEYTLGTQQLYITRLTFMSKTSDTLATVIANTLGRSDISLYAVPVACPSP